MAREIKHISKVKDIPNWNEFERLQRENPAEYRRLYRESMECLGRATRRLSHIAIAISTLTVLLFLMRVLLKI